MGWAHAGILALYRLRAFLLEGISRPVAPMVLMFVGNIANAALAYVLGAGARAAGGRRRVGVATATALVRWGSASAPCCWCC